MSVARVVMLSLAAASAAVAQTLPPIRDLGAPVATATESFRGMPSVRALSDGRVLVSDMSARRLVIYDSALSKSQPVLNPSGAAAVQFPARGGLLLAIPGDTTLVYDAAGYSFVVLDPLARVSRVIAMPRATDSWIMSSREATPVIDDRMRMIYRTRLPPTGFSRATGNAIYPDSTAVIAVSFETRKVDTLAWMKIPPYPPTVSTREADGRWRYTSIQPPFELTDEWAAMHDGTVAVIRWRDYHVDWVKPDGTKESSPRTAWNWVRMSDDEKGRFIDTLKAALQKNDSVSQSQNMMFSMSGSVSAPIFETLTVSPSEVPDYPPPFVVRSTRVDLDGRIWILERANIGSRSPLVYDVIDRSGQIVDRVRMPANAAVLGFGPGGSVYLSITPQNNSLAASMVQQITAGAPPGAMSTPVKVARAVLAKRP